MLRLADQSKLPDPVDHKGYFVASSIAATSKAGEHPDPSVALVVQHHDIEA